MIPYEEFLPLLPHEYSYALYLSYGFDLCMYDPMILNMVSERYPRDEDYASDSVIDEDFSDMEDGIPPWLFVDLEEEDASPIHQEDDLLNIVFGNFNQDSYLETFSVAPLISIEPELDEFSIKIGEVFCPVAAVKQNDDEGSLENVGESQLLELDGSTTEFQSNRMEEIEICCDSDLTSESNNCTKDEARIDFCKSTDLDLAKRLQKDAVISEIVPTSRFSFNVILNVSNAITPRYFQPSDAANQLQENAVFFQIVPSTPTFINDSTIRFSIVPFHSSFSPFSRDRTTSSFIPINLVSANYSQPSSITFDSGEASIETVYTKTPTDPDLEHKYFSDIIILTSVHSSSFFNQNSISVLVAADDFVCTKSFLNLVVLEEMVKEMEEDTASPEPPWELLCHGLQPHDRGKIKCTAEKFLVCVCVLRCCYCLLRRCSSIGPTLGQCSFFTYATGFLMLWANFGQPT